MHDNDGNGILGSNALSPPPEGVVVDDTPSENSGDVVEGVKLACNSRRKGVNIGTGDPTASLNGDDDDAMGEFNRGEVDGLFCPICYEAWSSNGDHRVCCLPCGHIYGLSCIKSWLGFQGSSECPQCKNKCRIENIRLLYATRLVTIDGKLQKKVQSLEARCASFEKNVYMQQLLLAFMQELRQCMDEQRGLMQHHTEKLALTAESVHNLSDSMEELRLQIRPTQQYQRRRALWQPIEVLKKKSSKNWLSMENGRKEEQKSRRSPRTC